MNKNDLRYIKTEENIMNAFTALLASEDFSKITVKKICDLARCSRNTFYLHYESKYVMMDKIIEDLLASLSKSLGTAVDTIDEVNQDVIQSYSKGLIETVRQNEELLRAIAKWDEGTFRRQYEKEIEKNFIKNANIFSNKSQSEEYRLMMSYLSSAITGFIFSWLEGSSLSLEEAETTLNVIHQGAVKSSLAFLK